MFKKIFREREVHFVPTMKSWSRLCFLVLAISSISRGQNETTVPPGVRKGATLTTGLITYPQVTPTPAQDETQNQTTGTTAPSSSPQSQTPAGATDRLPTVSTTQGEETPGTEGEVNGSAAAQTTASGDAALNVEKDVKTTAGTASTPVIIEEAGPSSWAYVILVLIILVIIILCVILFFIRRLSRTYSYSFNPHRQAPANHLDEPTGTFETVYLDDLERPSSKDQAATADLSLPPVSNGTTLPSEDRRSNGESALQGQTDAKGPEASPTSNTSNTSPSLGRDPTDHTPSPLSCSNMFFDATGEEQQNENNNNNPSVCSSDPFVEINLDEAALSDQLLTSLEAPSSVFPFSPFSFSSSSSSSSTTSLHLH